MRINIRTIDNDGGMPLKPGRHCKHTCERLHYARSACDGLARCKHSTLGFDDVHTVAYAS
jgi:hypothetical protein